MHAAHHHGRAPPRARSRGPRWAATPITSTSGRKARPVSRAGSRAPAGETAIDEEHAHSTPVAPSMIGRCSPDRVRQVRVGTSACGCAARSGQTPRASPKPEQAERACPASPNPGAGAFHRVLSVPRPATTVRAPGTSRRASERSPVVDGGEAGRDQLATTPIGTFTRNTHSSSSQLVSRPRARRRPHHPRRGPHVLSATLRFPCCRWR